jgi:hypothetical protein
MVIISKYYNLKIFMFDNMTDNNHTNESFEERLNILRSRINDEFDAFSNFDLDLQGLDDISDYSFDTLNLDDVDDSLIPFHSNDTPLVRIDNRLKISYDHDLICCICCEADLKTVMTLNGKCLKLNDVKLECLYNKKIDETFIFIGGCEKHSTCVKCLRTLSLDFYNHTINQDHPYIKCEDSEVCINKFGFYTYYEHPQIQKILSKKEFEKYMQFAETYEFPGFHQLKCPICNVKNIIPVDKVTNSIRGELIIECAQNCRALFCFHCDKRIVGSFNEHCSECVNSSLMTDPNRYNHFFYKRLIDRSSMYDLVYRNFELSVDIIIEQIKEIVIDNDDAVIRCPVCLIQLYKTELCNTMEHCKVETCYSCGKIGDKHRNFRLGDHWSEIGIKGCPRWDSGSLWNDLENCNFMCSKCCYGEDLGDCLVEEHQQGIKNMKECRKKMQIYHKLKSLLHNLRSDIINIMQNDDVLRFYIPPQDVFDVIKKDPSLYDYFSYNSFIHDEFWHT